MRLRKNLTEEQLDDIAGTIDNEGLGYMILWGGLGEASPENMLDNEEDIKVVRAALKVVQKYAELMPRL